MSFDFVEAMTAEYHPGVISDGMMLDIVNHLWSNSNFRVLNVRHLDYNRVRRYDASYKQIRESDKVLSVNYEQRSHLGTEKFEKIITITNGQVANAKFE